MAGYFKCDLFSETCTVQEMESRHLPACRYCKNRLFKSSYSTWKPRVIQEHPESKLNVSPR